MHSLLDLDDLPREGLLALVPGAVRDLHGGIVVSCRTKSDAQRPVLRHRGRALALTRHPPGHQATQELPIPTGRLRLPKGTHHRLLRVASVHHQQRARATRWVSFVIVFRSWRKFTTSNYSSMYAFAQLRGCWTSLEAVWFTSSVRIFLSEIRHWNKSRWCE